MKRYLFLFCLVFSFQSNAKPLLWEVTSNFPDWTNRCITPGTIATDSQLSAMASCGNGKQFNNGYAEFRNCKWTTNPRAFSCETWKKYTGDGEFFKYRTVNYSARLVRQCPDGKELISGRCQVPPNYCDTSEGQHAVMNALTACQDKLQEGQKIVRNEANCDRATGAIKTYCEIEDKEKPSQGGDTGSGGDSGSGGDTGSGSSGSGGSGSGGSGSGGSGSGGSGSGGSGSGGSGSGGSGSGGSGSGGSGSGGSGSGGSGSGGSGSGGSGSGGSGSGGSSSGGDKGSEKIDVDLSGVISAINGHKNKMAGYLETLQQNSATELQKWDDNQALVNKYYETAKESSSSLDHMKKFSEQELATLKELQGQFGTNFDRAYEQNNNLIAATQDLNTTNNQGFDKVDKQIKDSMDKLNQVFADADKTDKEKLDELKQANSDKLDEVKQSNSDKLDEIKSTIENKTDEQTTALTKSIDGLGDKIDGLELDVDMSGVESKLSDVGSKLDDQNGMLAELGKGGQRNLGGCRTRGNCTSFVTSEYPNGLEGIMTSHFETLKTGAFIGVVNQFNMSFPSQAPEWSLCLDIIIDFGCYDIRLPAIVWTFVRICIMFTAFMTCRKLVFGG